MRLTFLPGTSDEELKISQLVQHDVAVEKTATVSDMLKVLSAQCGIPSADLIPCDIYEGRVFASLLGKRPVSRIRDDDITVVFQMRPRQVAPEVDDRTPEEPPTSADAADFDAETGDLARFSVLVCVCV